MKLVRFGLTLGMMEKAKKQESELRVIKEEKHIEEPKGEALVEKVGVEKEIGQKEEEQKDEIKEGKDAKEIVHIINDHIADFNTR